MNAARTTAQTIRTTLAAPHHMGYRKATIKTGGDVPTTPLWSPLPPSTAWGTRTADARPRASGATDMHDSDTTDDLDFAMLTPPTRPGPCKAATAPETDPVEKRLEREREAAPFIADHFTMTHRAHGGQPLTFTCERIGATPTFHVTAVEVRHGSGKI